MSLCRLISPLSCSGARYESFPLICPSRVVCARPSALATPKSRTVRCRRCRPKCSAVIRRDAPFEAARRVRFGLVSGVKPVQHTCHDRTGDRCGDRRTHSLGCAHQARQRFPLYEIHDQKKLTFQRDHVSVETTLGWRMRAARRASSRNIDTNSGSADISGCERLMATVRENPPGRVGAQGAPWPSPLTLWDRKGVSSDHPEGRSGLDSRLLHHARTVSDFLA